MTELLSTGCLGPHGEPVEVGINGDGLWGPERLEGGPENKGSVSLGLWGAFLVCQRPDEGRESLVSPTGSRKAFFPGACLACVLELLEFHEHDWPALFFPGTPYSLKRYVMSCREGLLTKRSPFPASMLGL